MLGMWSQCNFAQTVTALLSWLLQNVIVTLLFNTLRLRQNGRRFPDNIFKCIFLYENVWISIKISLKFVPKGPINNIPALVQIMAWRRPGDKPSSEPMMVRLLTHICITRPQWVNVPWISNHMPSKMWGEITNPFLNFNGTTVEV